MKTHPIRTAIVVLLFTALVVNCKKSETKAVICYPTTTIATSPGITTLRTETIFYNSINQPTTYIYFSGTTTITDIYSYDSKGNCILLVETSGTTTTSFAYTYDGNDRNIQRDKTVGVVLTERATFQFNSTGQRTSSTFITYSGTPPVPSAPTVTTYTYPNTTTKNSSKVTYASGATSLFEYDNKPNAFRIFFPSRQPDNNVTKETYTSSGTTTIYTHTYQYNSNGYPTSDAFSVGTSSSSTTTITYNCK